jgi:hypothetical protein
VLAVVAVPALVVLAVVGRAVRVWLRVQPTARYWRRLADAEGDLLADDPARRRGGSVRVVNLSVTDARVADADGRLRSRPGGCRAASV